MYIFLLLNIVKGINGIELRTIKQKRFKIVRELYCYLIEFSVY